MRRLTVVQRSK